MLAYTHGSQYIKLRNKHMKNNELLLAISDIMDQKLNTIHVRMDTMEDRLTAKIDEVDNRLTTELHRLDAKIDKVEQSLSADIQRLDTKIDNVERSLNAKIDNVEQGLKADIHHLNLTMENIVIPRVNHIEQCYLATSERYINETARIDGLAADVQVLKSVVQKHSEQLQELSA